MSRLLLCTDMDRTVIPNGLQPEADDAREQFHALSALDGVELVYVTGRHLTLMEQAIDEFALPKPNYAITDVGTRIYYRAANQWRLYQPWQNEIHQDWALIEPEEVFYRLEKLNGIQAQEAEKQNPHKISFYVDVTVWQEATCLAEVSRILAPLNINSNLIWSIDETTHTGLLDILPAKANKLHAIRFLQQRLGYLDNELIFAGDSGNDLPVLVSSVQSVLVANATDEVKSQALAQARQLQNTSRLYVAEHGSDGSGNYSAGVLQGVLHYMPELKTAWENQFLAKR